MTYSLRNVWEGRKISIRCSFTQCWTWISNGKRWIQPFFSWYWLWPAINVIVCKWCHPTNHVDASFKKKKTPARESEAWQQWTYSQRRGKCLEYKYCRRCVQNGLWSIWTWFCLVESLVYSKLDVYVAKLLSTQRNQIGSPNVEPGISRTSSLFQHASAINSPQSCGPLPSEMWKCSPISLWLLTGVRVHNRLHSWIRNWRGKGS